MLFEKIKTEAGQIAQTSKVTFDFKEINVNIPAPTDARIRTLIDQSARELELSTKQMPSGAGHDAQDMARLAPAGMIFIPSIGGCYPLPETIPSSKKNQKEEEGRLHSVFGGGSKQTGFHCA